MKPRTTVVQALRNEVKVTFGSPFVRSPPTGISEKLAGYRALLKRNFQNGARAESPIRAAKPAERPGWPLDRGPIRLGRGLRGLPQRDRAHGQAPCAPVASWTLTVWAAFPSENCTVTDGAPGADEGLTRWIEPMLLLTLARTAALLLAAT